MPLAGTSNNAMTNGVSSSGRSNVHLNVSTLAASAVFTDDIDDDSSGNRLQSIVSEPSSFRQHTPSAVSSCASSEALGEWPGPTLTGSGSNTGLRDVFTDLSANVSPERVRSAGGVADADQGDVGRSRDQLRCWRYGRFPDKTILQAEPVEVSQKLIKLCSGWSVSLGLSERRDVYVWRRDKPAAANTVNEGDQDLGAATSEWVQKKKIW